MTFELLFDTSVKAAILAAVAFAATRGAGLAEARNGHRLWLLTLASLVVLPIAAVLVSPVAVVVPSAGLRSAVPPVQAGLKAPALIIYIAVATLFLLRVGAGLLHVRALLRRSIPVDATSGTEAGDLSRACVQAGALLVESAVVAVPATAGFLRPHVLLPSGWRDLDRDSVRAAVMHELAHVRRSDYLVTVLVDVLRAIWWFHPVAWVGRRQVRWFAEVASDQDAATHEGQEPYAKALLTFARAGEPRLAFILTATSALGQRVELLLARSRPRSIGIRVALVATAVLALLFMAARFSPVARATGNVSSFPHANSHVHAHRH